MGQGKWMVACTVAFVALGMSSAWAQEDDAAKAAARRLYAAQGVPIAATDGAATKRIEGALHEPLRSPFDFIETPLRSVMQVVAEEYDIPIQFDEVALESVAQSPDTEISVNIRNVSLRSALELIFARTEDLTYIVDNEVLLITSEDEASSRLEVRVYRVDDLIHPDGGALQLIDADFDSVIELVVTNIEKDSWAQSNTGEGEIQPFAPGMLVISQTRRVHEQVGQLFDTLRSIKRDVLADAADAESDKLMTRGLSIRDGAMAQSMSDRNVLRDVLMRSADWAVDDEQLAEDILLNVLPTRVIVRHKPEVVRQVAQTLHDLAMDEKPFSGPRALASGAGNGSGSAGAQTPASQPQGGAGNPGGRGRGRGGF